MSAWTRLAFAFHLLLAGDWLFAELLTEMGYHPAADLEPPRIGSWVGPPGACMTPSMQTMSLAYSGSASYMARLTPLRKSVIPSSPVGSVLFSGSL